MKNIFVWLLVICGVAAVASARDIKPIEGAYYGTNYTVPFAHAYRALGELGVDRKEAIDRDVYHLSRLGLNAFRLHLWDVELSDSVGNLIDNEHLDLLDYLLSQLEKRGISIILTAQTNFGNGYPERNTDPNGAFTYDYEKCKVHEDPAAIRAQENYISQLVRHVNPYNGMSYADDPAIIAMEINNEPCHTSSAEQVTEYINTMAAAMRHNGWDKTVLYNVSHNQDVARGYFDADIDGTTYQWYPLNLVSGHTRQGNFLPFVDQYAIPFKDMPNYDTLSRVIYEYDPADNLYSYIFPAAARTFRKEGFSWITQFAYDPIDMAWANTEYQTHYLNLAYTPGKALGMMVAAEVVRQTPEGADYGKYPCDTVFGPFTISAKQDLAVLNDGKKFFYTNNTDILPLSPKKLEQVAGRGSSPVVSYDGSGAYFLDKISDGVWRLEVMPDVVLTQDPFAKPSLSRRVGEIVYNQRPMAISLLPGLKEGFAVLSKEGEEQKTLDGAFMVSPGVYLIGNDVAQLRKVSMEATYGDGFRRVGEYVAPAPSGADLAVAHKPAAMHSASEPLNIEVVTVSDQPVDSVVLYPSSVSFWREHNDLIKLDSLGYGRFGLCVDPQSLGWGKPDQVSYNLVVYKNGLPYTYPSGQAGTPLDWDYIEQGQYATNLYYPDRSVRLLEAKRDMDGSAISLIPGEWGGVRYDYVAGSLPSDDAMAAAMAPKDQETKIVVFKYVGDILGGISDMDNGHKVWIETDSVSGATALDLALITRDGLSYKAPLSMAGGVQEFGVEDFQLGNTLLCPEPFPVFMSREFEPCETARSIPLRLSDIETIQVIATVPAHSAARLPLKSIGIR